MNDTSTDPSRRRFLRSGAQLSAGVLAFGLLGTDSVALAEPSKVSESSKLAKQLHYYNDATKVKVASHKKGQMCSGCLFFKGKKGAQWGPCPIFQGKLVSAKGWCTSFQAAS